MLIAGGVLAGVAVIAGGALLGVVGLRRRRRHLGPGERQDDHRHVPTLRRGPDGRLRHLKSDLSAKSTLGSTGVWLLVGGGVVGLGTLLYGLVAGQRAAPSAVTVTPVLTGRGGGLFAGGTFE